MVFLPVEKDKYASCLQIDTLGGFSSYKVLIGYNLFGLIAVY